MWIRILWLMYQKYSLQTFIHSLRMFRRVLISRWMLLRNCQGVYPRPYIQCSFAREVGSQYSYTTPQAYPFCIMIYMKQPFSIFITYNNLNDGADINSLLYFTNNIWQTYITHIIIIKNDVIIIEKFVRVSFTNRLPNLKYELKSLQCLAAIELRHL